MKPYDARGHGSETARHLVGGAAFIIVLAALAFAATRLGSGALFAAIGTLAIIGAAITLVYVALKVIEWLGGRE